MTIPTPSSSVASHSWRGSLGPSNARGRRCLVVDDDMLARRWLVVQLERLGLDVVDCDGARTADLLLQKEVFPLVFLDCVLEDGDGYTIARSIRQRHQGSDSSPLIVGLSASTGGAHERACRAAGMDAVLCKPASSPALLAVLKGYVDEPVPMARPVESDDVDGKVAVALHAACLEEAAMLRLAIDAADTRRVRHHAHRLRGTALLAGLSVIAEEAAALEEASRPGQWVTIVAICARLSDALNAGRA